MKLIAKLKNKNYYTDGKNFFETVNESIGTHAVMISQTEIDKNAVYLN